MEGLSLRERIARKQGKPFGAGEQIGADEPCQSALDNVQAEAKSHQEATQYRESDKEIDSRDIDRKEKNRRNKKKRENSKHRIEGDSGVDDRAHKNEKKNHRETNGESGEENDYRRSGERHRKKDRDAHRSRARHGGRRNEKDGHRSRDDRHKSEDKSDEGVRIKSAEKYKDGHKNRQKKETRKKKEIEIDYSVGIQKADNLTPKDRKKKDTKSIEDMPTSEEADFSSPLPALEGTVMVEKKDSKSPDRRRKHDKFQNSLENIDRNINHGVPQNNENENRQNTKSSKQIAKKDISTFEEDKTDPSHFLRTDSSLHELFLSKTISTDDLVIRKAEVSAMKERGRIRVSKGVYCVPLFRDPILQGGYMGLLLLKPGRMFGPVFASQSMMSLQFVSGEKGQVRWVRPDDTEVPMQMNDICCLAYGLRYGVRNRSSSVEAELRVVVAERGAAPFDPGTSLEALTAEQRDTWTAHQSGDLQPTSPLLG